MITLLLVGTLAVVGAREALGVVLDALPWSLSPSIAPIFWVLVVGGLVAGFLTVPFTIQLGAGIFGLVGIVRALMSLLSSKRDIIHLSRSSRGRIPPLP